MSQLLVQGKVHAFLKKMQYLPEKVKEIRRAGPVWVLRKHAGFILAGEGRVARRPCGGLSGHGSLTAGRGERSPEPSSFCLAGAKAACLRTTLPELFKRFLSRPAFAKNKQIDSKNC